MRPLAFLMLLTVALGGCAATGASEFQTTILDTSDYDLAYQAALRAVRERFQIIRHSQATGTIQTRPRRDVDKLAPASDRRVSEVVVPRRQNIRRTASVRVRRAAGGIVADCRIKLERLDTETFRSQQQREREFQDMPTDTPIDRGAGSGGDQQRVWTDVGRDRTMEGKLLARIRQCLAEMQTRRKSATSRAAE